MACPLPLGLSLPRLKILKQIAQLDEERQLQAPIGLIPKGVKLLKRIGLLPRDSPTPSLPDLKKLIIDSIGDFRVRLPIEDPYAQVEEHYAYQQKHPTGLDQSRLMILKQLTELDESDRNLWRLLPQVVRILEEIGVLYEECPLPPLDTLKQLIMDTIGEMKAPVGLNPAKVRILMQIARHDEWLQPPDGLIPKGVGILTEIGMLKENCPPPSLRILKNLIQHVITDQRYFPDRECNNPRRPRNPARYVRKRFNEGMGCVRNAFGFNYPM